MQNSLDIAPLVEAELLQGPWVLVSSIHDRPPRRAGSCGHVVMCCTRVHFYFIVLDWKTKEWFPLGGDPAVMYVNQLDKLGFSRAQHIGKEPSQIGDTTCGLMLIWYARNIISKWETGIPTSRLPSFRTQDIREALRLIRGEVAERQ